MNTDINIKIQNKEGRIASLSLITCFSGTTKVSLIYYEGNKNTVYKSKGFFGIYEDANEEFNTTFEKLKKKGFVKSL
ncbi:hypothetical protein LCGC14_2635570 [marine sediment metagenome]|uniref:WGR domain-containing protein n=1 Tax=marine sediment metagenome TaxID=412755 RepID=A0A0F9CRC6_9ZZZZ